MNFIKIFLFCLLCGITPVFAGVREPTAQERETTNLLAQEIIKRLEDKLNTAYQEGATGQDAEFVRQALALPDPGDGKYLVLVYFADQLFYEYKNKIVEFLEQKSHETGRKLIAETSELDDGYTESRWWLDRGKMDSEKCNWDFKKRQACDYEDGFSEYSIISRVYNTDDNFYWSQDLRVHFDDVAQNKTNIISFVVTTRKSRNENQIMYDVNVRISGDEQKYDEFYKWQNQMAADVRAGWFRRATRAEKRKYKGSPFSVDWVGDESQEWESQKIPDSIGVSGFFYGSYSSSKN